tara:strand:+ start:1541 stop:2002 length:462 start_codon:yes stop_codon:yes gene_type:complete
VFDHVQARRVLEQPAREHLAELVLGPAFLDQQLDEGPGFARHFPRRSALAGLQADDHVAHALLVAGLQFEIAADIVALVEQAERGDAFRHRRADSRFGGRLHRQRVLLQLFGNVGGDGFFGRFGLLLAARGHRRHGQEGKRPAHRHASGDQAS